MRPLVGGNRSTTASSRAPGWWVIGRLSSGCGASRRQPYAGSVTPTSTLPDATFDDVTRSEASLRRFLHGLPGRRPGRRGGARRRARHPLDQDHRQGLRPRPRDPDGRPDHARGRRTPPARSGRWPPRRCAPTRPTRPARPAAAVCVYPDMVATAKRDPRRSPACTSPPSPRRSPAAARRSTSSSPTPATRSRPAPTRSTWSSTAGAFLSGRYLQVFDEIVAVKAGLRRRRTSR